MLTRISRWALRVATRPLATRGHHQDPQAIVVLGAPVRPDGSLPPAVRERVEVGAELARHYGVPVVLSGKGKRGPAEAPAMAAHARRLGLGEDRMVIEADSLSTADNARCCAALLLPERRRVVVVSQPFHLRRACALFRAAGFEAVGASAEHSVQFRSPWRGWRWTAREYLALAAAVTGTRKSAK